MIVDAPLSFRVRSFWGIDLAAKWRETFIEQYAGQVQALMLPGLEIYLSEQDRIALGASTPGFSEALLLEPKNSGPKGLHQKIEAALARFRGGLFLRTGATSFKSSFLPVTPAKTVKRAMDILSLPNRRAAAFLADSLVNGYDLNLFAFPWRDIPPWAEFRIFIRERRVVGISQYYHQSSFPEIAVNERAIKAALADFCRDLLDALHMDTVVADVFVEPQEDGRFRTTLIELNPFIQRTDPCLYTWKNGGDFDGGFRYLGAQDRSQAVRSGRQQLVDDPWQLPS